MYYKVQSSKKKILSLLFFSKFYEIFQGSYSTKSLRAVASFLNSVSFFKLPIITKFIYQIHDVVYRFITKLRHNFTSWSPIADSKSKLSHIKKYPESRKIWRTFCLTFCKELPLQRPKIMSINELLKTGKFHCSKKLYIAVCFIDLMYNLIWSTIWSLFHGSFVFLS